MGLHMPGAKMFKTAMIWVGFSAILLSGLGGADAKGEEKSISVLKLSKAQIRKYQKDIGGNQGKCIFFNAMDIKEYESDYKMIIPDDNSGIKFIKKGEKHASIVCGRFTEDTYDYEGKLESSKEYHEIEGY